MPKTIVAIGGGEITKHETLSYDYDDLNRLLSAQSGGLSIGDYRESYTYDSLGNMTSKSDVGSMVYGGTGSPNPHAVTEVNGTAYTYDANGNLLSDGTHSYTWDKRNRLIGGSGQSFSYDFSGQRYKTVDSAAGTNVYTYYITPLMELRDHSPASAGTLVYNIFAGSQRVATVSDGLYSYVLQDHLGGTALITDESGAVTEVYDYYPYGAELIEDLLGSTETAHTFTDKEFSEELGLYYFEARWYNPSIGRFASLDPAQLDGLVENKFSITNDINEFLKKNKIFAPQILNFYSYALNNPITHIDPDGENPIVLIWEGIRFFFSDIPSAGDSGDFINPESINDYNDGDISNNVDDVAWNSIKSQTPWYIKIGMFIYEQVLITTFGDEKNITYNQEGGYSVYTVEPGDTMYELFGDDYQSIADYNGIEDANTLYVGEEIRIPTESQQESDK